MRHPLETGISLFNSGRYFEAHEAFEDLWRASEGDVRLLYQGLVQACAGLVKQQRGQTGSACTLLRKSLRKLTAALPSCWTRRVDLPRLARDLNEHLRALEEGRPCSPPSIHGSGDL